MTLISSQTRSPLSIEGKKITGTRIYLPSHLEQKANFFAAGINKREKLGIYGSFGILISGVPGGGKTHFVRYLAEKTTSNFFEVPMLSSPDEVTSVFNTARESVCSSKVASILAFNDLDYVGKRSESTNQPFRPLLASLLGETDFSDKNLGVFWFITSNEPHLFDDALRRPPRVTFELEILPPTRSERTLILKAVLKDEAVKVQWNDNLIDKAASVTFGFTPGDLIGFVQNTVVQCVLRAGEQVSEKDIHLARAMQKPSAIRDLPFIEPTDKLTDLKGAYISKQVDAMAELTSRIQDGMLTIIYGPSGCGKTALARAVAGQSGYNTLYFDSAKVMDKYIGESGKILDKMFSRAKVLAPCFLIIDQAEGIVNRSNQYSDEWLSVLKNHTSERIPGVWVMLITTDPSSWGDEILGRFDKIYVPKADERSLAEIIAHYAQDSKIDSTKVIAEVGGKLSPRQIKSAFEKIRSFNTAAFKVEPTTELLIELIKRMPKLEHEVDYEQVLKQIGNDADLFDIIRKKGNNI